MTKLATLLDQIDSGTLLLPEFQRGYVWNRDQVRGLMTSLYRGYPVGSLLIWETEPSVGGAAVRGETVVSSGAKLLLLDGQQRITSLYGVMRGRPPAFFEGDANAFLNLRFNVAEERFEFYAASRMKDDPRWVDVTRLFTDGLTPLISALSTNARTQPHLAEYLSRLTKLHGLLEREFHEEKITGVDKSIDVVVDIFNKVNSGGTKLSKGDLALAKICAEWPPARATMRGHLASWQKAGYERFTLDWLLRNVTAVAKGRAQFTALEKIQAPEFESALQSSADYIGRFLEALAGRLGLDHNRVLLGHYAFPVVSRFLHLNGGMFDDAKQRDRMLFWFVQSGLWGRFAGSVETVLTQDYETLERARRAGEDGIGALIDSVERWRGGNLTISPHDFDGWSIGSRFYPLLYLLTRVCGARDFGSGLPLHSEMLGKLTSLQMHHVFPKAVLYEAGYQRSQVNAVANFCFLTQETNLKIGMRSPEDYFPQVEAAQPGALASQWIPTDPQLWRIDRYPDFLEARRELLAQAANSFLTELRNGTSTSSAPELGRIQVSVSDEQPDVRAVQITSMLDELEEFGFVAPRLDAEIADPDTGVLLGVAEAFWPDGLQPGQGDPVVLELDPEDTDVARIRELGYEVFTSVDSLLGFARRRSESRVAEAADEADATQAQAGQDTELSKQFDAALRELYERTKAEAGYNATTLLRMLAEHGGVGAAKRVLALKHMSDGFAALWERGRLDLSVEAFVLDPKWAPLFTAEELEGARQVLLRFNYVP
ncbi:DUF262 domain-containing protein [Actinomadura logoneensis]|uniref:DUF262 domain-containing protein n=1 Tax=Actinomadura logoneensis TaxID=2293572 RepID=A0A372JHF4_9ACTN|nr:DUF262 domain-containing protein [Actinomadura logoneensis]RFU39433.1 DUF262 domain-containing protein [Actinomadura logoneensis]